MNTDELFTDDLSNFCATDCLLYILALILCIPILLLCVPILLILDVVNYFTGSAE